MKNTKFHKPRKSTKMILYAEKLKKKQKSHDYKDLSGSKERNNITAQSPHSRATTAATSKQAALLYGERMFMSKYSNKPKFLKTLNSTLSPRK